LRIQFLGILIQNERIVSHPNKAEGTPWFWNRYNQFNHKKRIPMKQLVWTYTVGGYTSDRKAESDKSLRIHWAFWLFEMLNYTLNHCHNSGTSSRYWIIHNLGKIKLNICCACLSLFRDAISHA
jgi:hypothetical protein